MENKFEIKNKMGIFIGVLFLTIIITRILINFKDLDIILRGYELHHFYYGVALLIILNLSILFGRHHQRLYLIGSAIAIGLISDEFLFVMKGLSNREYTSTILHSVFITVIILMILLVIVFHVLDLPKRKKK